MGLYPEGKNQWQRDSVAVYEYVTACDAVVRAADTYPYLECWWYEVWS